MNLNVIKERFKQFFGDEHLIVRLALIIWRRSRYTFRFIQKTPSIAIKIVKGSGYSASLWFKGCRIRGGKKRVAPTFSNQEDCRRYDCPMTPWHWGSRWVLERAQLTGKEIVIDLGAGVNPITLDVYEKLTKQTYLVDDLLLPNENLSPHLKRILTDISCISLPDESVDVAISISVLEHLPVLKRLATMKEISRILKPGGRALLSIGLPLRVSDEARLLMTNHPFFTDRGCPLYLPIDIKQMLGSVSKLHLSGVKKAEQLDYLPGYGAYDEAMLLDSPNLVLEHWDDYPALADYPSLMRVMHCEIGLMLIKSG